MGDLALDHTGQSKLTFTPVEGGMLHAADHVQASAGVCAWCGKPLQRNIIGPQNKKFCNRECKTASRNERLKLPRQPIAKCQCGKLFIPRKRGGKQQKYCSKLCRNKYKMIAYRATDRGRKIVNKAGRTSWNNRKHIQNPKRRIGSLSQEEAEKRRRESRMRWPKRKAWQQKYYRENRQRIRETSRKRYSKREEVRIKALAYNRIRRASLYELSKEQRNAVVFWELGVKSKQSFVCNWCRNVFDIKMLHIDHIVPIKRGGSSKVSNLCCSCASCNTSKKAHLPEEWKARPHC